MRGTLLTTFLMQLPFCRKIAKTRVALSSWNKTQFGKLQNNISALRAALAEAQDAGLTPDSVQKEKDLRLSLSEQLLCEEIHWRQKSRVKWIKEGDSCTKFFFITKEK
ncbi:hypothetical protein PanWU01x14_367930 [Parasponia andersonii]|uniref:Uncharacterized protein n=1 Tax=Parasponia andersonii TaxID=3476 RepID=A0A2P5A569_PARAD|nr:hypothetical protein PanWU01x14_367930 [Parasponia andersonii]